MHKWVGLWYRVNIDNHGNNKSEIGLNSYPIRVWRYTGVCPGCNEKRSILRELTTKVAFCEACFRGYTVAYLDQLAEESSEEGGQRQC